MYYADGNDPKIHEVHGHMPLPVNLWKKTVENGLVSAAVGCIGKVDWPKDVLVELFVR